MSVWRELLPNLAVVAIATSVWTLGRRYSFKLGERTSNLLLEIVMAAGVLGTMAIPFEFIPGVLLDARYTLLAVASYFGGPLGALPPLVVAIVRRVWIGGLGVSVAVPQIVAASLGGLLLHHLAKAGLSKFGPMFVLAAWSAACGTAGFYVRYPVSNWLEITTTTLPLATLLFGATLLSGLAFIQELKREAATQQNYLHRAVIEALPDSLNAKDRDGRFIVANPATAALMGTEAIGLIGRKDSDFYAEHTANLFRLPELDVLNSGIPVTVEQRFTRNDGAETWLSTLKAPLRDEGGKILGVVTHNREITERKRLESDLQKSQARLRDAIESMTEGIAMFDAHGVLVLHNEHFRSLFPLTADVRVPGANISEIVRASLARGEIERPTNDFESVVEWTVDLLMKAGERALRLTDGRTFDARTSRTSDGGSIIVFADVTIQREREERLRELTKKYAVLAKTDGLTELVNRRAFDVALTNAAEAGPFSLLMIDVDRFKAFNDGYGHPEGDACLRAVAACLSQIFSTYHNAVVARYGGEEFAVILPGLTETSAFSAGQLASSAIRGLAIRHDYSDKRVVTVSVGVAYCGRSDYQAALRAADAGLYAAKGAGRDCVREGLPEIGGIRASGLAVTRRRLKSLPTSRLQVAHSVRRYLRVK